MDEPGESMSSPHQLGDLQLAIIRVLWERGEAAASEVHRALEADRDLAISTTKTMLRKMEDRGLVSHRARGRQFVYRPLLAEGDVREGMVGDLVQRLFRGDTTALVNHLIEAGEIDAAELDQLRGELARRRAEK